MARTARSAKAGQQTLVNRPMRSTKSVYKTVQAQPTPGSKNTARKNGRDPLVDKPPGQHTPTDNPRVASKTARNQLVDKPPASAPPADNLGERAAEPGVSGLTAVIPGTAGRQTPGMSSYGNCEDGQLTAQTQAALTPELSRLIQDRVEQLITQARHNADKPRESASPIQGQQTGADKPHTAQQEAEQEVLMDSGDEDSSDSERLKPARKRCKKGKSRSRKSKEKNSKRRTHGHSSDDSSYEGESDQSEDYETEEDESMAVLRESFGMMVGENLPTKQKEKVLAGKFVEMSSLLPQNYTKDPDTVYRITKDGIKPAKQRQSKYLTLEEWNEAFGIFKAIMVEKPDTAADIVLLVKQLETYQRDINTLARQGKKWQLYDRMFRSDLAESKSKVSYGTIRHDLMLNIKNAYSKERSFRGRKDRQAVPTSNKWRPQPRNTDVCYAFNNRQQRCTFGSFKCKFSHTCSRCRGTHPRYTCEDNQMDGGYSQQRRQQNRQQGRNTGFNRQAKTNNETN